MAKLHSSKINYRENPKVYKIGRGEQGVLTVEPYKSEILPHWEFKTPEKAETSSQKIYAMFLDYLDQEDFVGADMARKFLRMGMTRAKRYARHPSGKKYDVSGKEKEEEFDAEKQKSSDIFKKAWQEAKANDQYQTLKNQHKESYN